VLTATRNGQILVSCERVLLLPIVQDRGTRLAAYGRRSIGFADLDPVPVTRIMALRERRAEQGTGITLHGISRQPPLSL